MMDLYLSGVAVLFLPFIYLPIALMVLVYLSRRLRRKPRLRWPATIVVALILAVAPIWDVILTTVDMRRLCATEAGTFIFETVTADGFFSDYFAGKHSLEKGFSFVEDEKPGGKITRYSILEGIITETEVEKSRSRYHVVSKEEEIVANKIARSGVEIIDVKGGRRLGETVDFTAYPGWLDEVLLRFFGPVVWRCELVNRGNVSLLIDGVLVPSK